MVRILLIVALLGAITSGIFGFLLNGQKQEWRGQYQATSSQLKTTSEQLQNTANELKATKENLEQTTTQLSEAKSRAEALTKDLGTAQGKVSDLERKITAAEASVQEAQSKLSEVQNKLGAESAAAKEAQGKLAEIERQRKILMDDLATEKAKVEELKSYIERAKTGEMPPGIMGRVVSINRNWNFVVLNIGLKQGVVENGEFVVYRDKEYVGKVRVVSTEANTAVADILPESLKSEVQVGDEVMN